MSDTPAILASSLRHCFGRLSVIDGIDLEVAPGSVVGIVGPNGAGKTTLIRILCGLLRPSAGSVRILGEDLASAGLKLRARMGVLTQETALYEELSVLQNLRFAAELFDLPSPKEAIDKALEVTGLQAKSRSPVAHLSGGMKRRLAIARALLHEPSLLIFDEPTVGVDVEARHRIWGHIRELRAAGRTILLTTNYMDEAEALCDRVCILGQGRIIADDTPANLTANTGRCLEISCSDASASKILESLSGRPEVLRAERAVYGSLFYVSSAANPEDLLQLARVIAPVETFRSRTPDLAEVFRSLTDGESK